MGSVTDLSEFEKDPRLFLFTSLTAGSSHIITATSRLETILKANKIPFQAIDIATDEKARRLWQRRAQKKKLPGLVKDGFVIGDLEEVEEWNEFGELKENIGPVPASNAAPSNGRQGVNIRPLEQGSPPEVDNTANVVHPAASKTASALVDESSRVALPGAAEIAARNKPKSPSNPPNEGDALRPVTSEPAVKQESTDTAKDISKQHPALDHLSAPASRIHSGSATPQTEPVSGPPESVGVSTSSRTHRGSEVREASIDEIRKLETEHALKEDPNEEAEDDATKGVRSLKFDEAVETQDDKNEDASKTTQD